MPETPQEEVPGLRVSAVIVAFNQADALRRAIAALEASTERERLEIVVVDCGSRDASSRMDAESPAINLLRLPHHLGAARAMNIGCRTAKADLLLFLSPNVEVEPTTVAELADRLERDEALAAACPLLVDPEGGVASKLRKIPTREQLSAACKGTDVPGSSPDPAEESIAVEYPALDALLIRKVFIRGMNYFDEHFGHAFADANLAMQLRRASKKAVLYPAIRAVYHPAPDPLQDDSLLRPDRVAGAGAFLAKYEGTMAGMTFRLGAALSALGRFQLAEFAAILGGQKLDGSRF